MTRPAQFDPSGYATRSGWGRLPYPYDRRRSGPARDPLPVRCLIGRHAWPIPPDRDVMIRPECYRCGLFLRWYRIGDHRHGQARNAAVLAVAHDLHALDEVRDVEWYGPRWKYGAGLDLGATPVITADRFPGLAGNPRHPRKAHR